MLTCLAAKTEQFPKDVFLLHPGDTVEEIGMVLSGCALVVQEDIWGNRNILSRTAPGQTYAAAFACAPSSVSNVSVVTETPTTVLFLNVKRLFDGLSLRLRAPQPHHPKPSERPCGKKPAAQ